MDPGASPRSWPCETRAASRQSRLQAGQLSISSRLAAASQWLTFIFKREMVSSSFFSLDKSKEIIHRGNSGCVYVYVLIYNFLKPFLCILICACLLCLSVCFTLFMVYKIRFTCVCIHRERSLEGYSERWTVFCSV